MRIDKNVGLIMSKNVSVFSPGQRDSVLSALLFTDKRHCVLGEITHLCTQNAE